MRYAARIDDNQNEIVSALRKAGATVRVVTQGGGLPDLLVGYQGKSLEKVKKLVNEGLEVFFEDHPFEVIESITAESEFNLK